MVSASEKEVKSKVGKVVASTKFAQKKEQANSAKEETVVIVGGGSGGLHAVESLRMVRPEESVTHLRTLSTSFRMRLD
jgi:23S rRNA pseudoU1915 N3-methylase RlmH